MKILPLFYLLPALTLPVAAVTTTKPAASDKAATPKTHKPATAGKPVSAASKPTVAAAQSTAPTPTPAVPASAPASKSTVTLNAYITELATDVPLSKDEQADIKTAYLDDGTKMKDILNDASLSPLEQTRQVDDLRDTRNDKIEALLHDGDRQEKFRHIEANYRVALVELAANGGLISTTPPAAASEPAKAPSAPAEKSAPTP